MRHHDLGVGSCFRSFVLIVFSTGFRLPAFDLVIGIDSLASKICKTLIPSRFLSYAVHQLEAGISIVRKEKKRPACQL